MFTQQQSDLILVSRKQGRFKSAPRAGSPLRHER